MSKQKKQFYIGVECSDEEWRKTLDSPEAFGSDVIFAEGCWVPGLTENPEEVRLKAEIERLLEAADGALLEDRDHLLAENERLRAIVDKLANALNECQWGDFDGSRGHCPVCFARETDTAGHTEDCIVRIAIKAAESAKEDSK